MYGLIGKMTSVDGRRDELINILLEGTKDMPGCLAYIVSKDIGERNRFWVTEVWESREKHEASLQLPSVQEAIAKGRPLIAAVERVTDMYPVGGQGL